MAKKKTTKKVVTKKVEPKEEVTQEEPVVQKTTTKKSNDAECIELLKVKFDGDEKLAAKRLKYIKAIQPAPENDAEVLFLVKRYIEGKPLTINQDRVVGPKFSEV